MRTDRFFAILAAAIAPLAVPGSTPAAGWSVGAVPGAWPAATRAAVAAADGWAWYRGWVKIDDGFLPAHERNLYEESVGITVADLAGAHEVFVNGIAIGTGGGFPPSHHDGARQTFRHKVPVGTLRRGEWNEVSIRVFLPPDAAAGGFLGDAPFIMNYFQECVLGGAWEFRAGRDPVLGGARVDRPPAAAFDTFRESNRVLGRTAQVHGPSLPPTEAAARIRPADDLAIDLLLHEPLVAQPFHVSFDERGRMWVTQSRQYPYPAGLRMLSRDKYYRAHYDKVPPAPPHHDRGADIVSIHESTRRDGTYDRHRVFLEGLNMADAAVRGHGGVWVMHTPYLLFYPDADFDDVPDGPPEVRLAGFGLEDSHAIANGLAWGPDGWLYGAQGSTSSCAVTRPGHDPPGTPPVAFTGCMIWRYHPHSRGFEIFSEGGGNNFGLEFDAVGRLFGGHNGGGTRGFHFVQGGVHLMQAADIGKYGPPRNPYAFGELPPLASADTIVRFTHHGAFADGSAMPTDRRGQLFSLDPLHNVVTAAVLTPRGATFQTRDLDPAVSCADPAFRPVFVTNAPDGSLCICDMYEFYIAHGQHYQNQIDPTTGRIYRLRGRDAVLDRDTDLTGRPTADLVGLLAHPGKWHRQTAVRLLGERRDPAAAALLRPLVTGDDPVAALHGLWALHQVAGLDEPTAMAALESRHPAVRAWAVRLSGDTHGACRGLALPPSGSAAGRLPATLFAVLADRSRVEDDREVLCQILSTARRLEPAQALPLAVSVLAHDACSDDPYLPMMGWWVFESLIPAHTAAVMAACDAAAWTMPTMRNQILPRLVRRLAVEQDRDLLACCATLFRGAPAAAAGPLMEGFTEAFRGRSINALPADLIAAIEAVGPLPLAFRLRRGDAAAAAEAVARVADAATPSEERLALIRTLGELRRPEAAEAIRTIALDRGAPPGLRVAALAALSGYAEPAIAADALATLSDSPATVRTAAFAVLASRPDWSQALLDAVAAGRVAAGEVPVDVADRLRGHKHPPIREAAARLLPAGVVVAGSPAARIDAIRRLLAAAPGDPYAGQILYRQKCGQCHRLFHSGGNVGPPLTTYQRDDLGTMLQSIVDPSAEIREGYQYHAVVTADGRSLSGFVVDRDEQVTVLRTLDGESVTLTADDIEEFEPIGKSLMPAGLLDGLTDGQIRDLFAYLRIKQPINAADATP